MAVEIRVVAVVVVAVGAVILPVLRRRGNLAAAALARVPDVRELLQRRLVVAVVEVDDAAALRGLLEQPALPLQLRLRELPRRLLLCSS